MRKEVILIMEKKMRKLHAAFLMLFGVLALQGRAQQAPPLRLIQTIRLPDTEGNFSHFGLDLKGNRLFATLEKLKSVDVPSRSTVSAESRNPFPCFIVRIWTVFTLRTIPRRL